MDKKLLRAARYQAKENLKPVLDVIKKIEQENKEMNPEGRTIFSRKNRFEKQDKTAIKSYKRSQEEEEQMGKKTAARFSDGKVRHDLIPPWPINELAKVYTYGTKKYDDDNWRKGLAWKKNVIGPLKRHLEKWIRGEKLDEESNCHHLAMVMWQSCALMEYERCSIGQDDRNPYDLSLMDEDERKRRIKIWAKHVLADTLDEYNGLSE